MSSVERISPWDVRKGVQAGSLLLVCAYRDEAKFQAMRLEGAISLSEFETMALSLSRNMEIVFYCA